MKLLRIALVLNATSCITFGFLFILFDSEVNAYIGNTYTWLLPAIGVVLLFNGLHLLIASKRKQPIFSEIVYFVLGDAAWVGASIILVFLDLVITSTLGVITSLLVALMVACFGMLQIVGYKKVCITKNA